MLSFPESGFFFVRNYPLLLNGTQQIICIIYRRYHYYNMPDYSPLKQWVTSSIVYGEAMEIFLFILDGMYPGTLFGIDLCRPGNQEKASPVLNLRTSAGRCIRSHGRHSSTQWRYLIRPQVVCRNRHFLQSGTLFRLSCNRLSTLLFLATET